MLCLGQIRLEGFERLGMICNRLTQRCLIRFENVLLEQECSGEKVKEGRKGSQGAGDGILKS